MRVRLLTAVALLLVAAVPLAAQPVGHLFQQPAEHVVLTKIGEQTLPLAACTFYRVMPDGTGVASRGGNLPFEVPTGRLLVITDVEWEVDKVWVYYNAWPLQANDVVRSQLRLKPAGTTGLGALVFQSQGVVVPKNNTIASSSEHLTAGVTVAADTSFCLYGWVDLDTEPRGVLRQVILRGYLIDAS